MVYLYKKKVGGTHHYYLRISERKGTRVIAKDLAHLGTSVAEVKKRLTHLTEYKEDIRKAHKHIQRILNTNLWHEKAQQQKLKKDMYLGNLLIDVEACRLHFTNQFKKKDTITQLQILKQFSIDFSYNTTSLEGNTITLHEAQRLLDEGLTPQNKTVREIYDLQNTEKVFLAHEAYTISHNSITALHAALMEHIDSRVGYRTEDIRVFKSHFEATPASYIKADMNLLISWYKKNKRNLHPLVLATVFHHKFEKIHPFMDGNGRTGRMLMNIILLMNKYPPIIIEKKRRAEYLDALQYADKEDISSVSVKKYTPLVKFTAEELVSKYWGLFL